MARMIFGNFLLFYSETFHYFIRKLFIILIGNFSPFHSETFHEFESHLPRQGFRHPIGTTSTPHHPCCEELLCLILHHDFAHLYWQLYTF